MSTQQFRITKELLNSYCLSGYTVKQMAQAITESSGVKCSENTVRNASKAYGIDLLRKPLRPKFIYGEMLEAPTVDANQPAVAEQRIEEQTETQTTPGFKF